MADEIPNDAATLTTEERLLAALTAQGITHQLLPLKTPMRRVVLEQVKWLLGEPQ